MKNNTMEKAIDLMSKAQQLISAYEETLETLEKGEELTDEQIDQMIGSESDMGKMLDALILMKTTQQNRRLIAEKEEKKCMLFITRIMKKLRVEEWNAEDGKAKGKVLYRRDYKDKTKIPKEFFEPVWGKVNSEVQKRVSQNKRFPGVEIFEGNLHVQVR